MISIVVVVKVVVVIGGFSRDVGLSWFLTLLFEGCVRAADCKWWKLFFCGSL